MNITVDRVLDCKGLACPMPIVKTKKGMEELQAGQVIEVLATDKGSVADIQGWAKNTGHQYIGTIEEGEVFKHYLRKANADEVKEETRYPHTVSHEELIEKMNAKENIKILDVREPAEYAFGRIPGAISIPMGELEERIGELNPEDEIHLVCRSGNRSDRACQLLEEKGFKKLKNVLPGMKDWSGQIEKN